MKEVIDLIPLENNLLDQVGTLVTIFYCSVFRLIVLM